MPHPHTPACPAFPAELIDDLEDMLMMHLERFEAENCYQSIVTCPESNPFRRAFIQRWQRESASWNGLLSPALSGGRDWGYALASNWLFSTLCERANLPELSIANFKTREMSLLRQSTDWISDEESIRQGFETGLRETWLPAWRRIHAAMERQLFDKVVART
jgi:hypothetical protein